MALAKKNMVAGPDAMSVRIFLVMEMLMGVKPMIVRNGVSLAPNAQKR